jgi:hypothetical protein
LYSLVHRRLDNQPEAAPEQRLQVFYPHLRETVEVLQVERVYERMNRFIRMLHRSLVGEALPESRIDTRHEFVLPVRDIQPIAEPLTTLFPVQDTCLHADWPADSTQAGEVALRTLDHFRRMVAGIEQHVFVRSEPQRSDWTFVGTAYVRPDGGLVPANAERGSARQQPFRLALWLFSEAGQTLVRCTSPIGDIDQNATDFVQALAEAQQKLGFARLCAVADDRQGTYHLTAETDLRFHPDTTQTEEVLHLLARTLHAADQLEQALSDVDAAFDDFESDMLGEGQRRE